jgi:hypothetical protein
MAIQNNLLKEVNGLMNMLVQSYGKDAFAPIGIVENVLGQVFRKDFLTSFTSQQSTTSLRDIAASKPTPAEPKPTLDIEGLDLELLNKLLDEHKLKETPKPTKASFTPA